MRLVGGRARARSRPSNEDGRSLIEISREGRAKRSEADRREWQEGARYSLIIRRGKPQPTTALSVKMRKRKISEAERASEERFFLKNVSNRQKKKTLAPTFFWEWRVWSQNDFDWSHDWVRLRFWGRSKVTSLCLVMGAIIDYWKKSISHLTQIVK